MLGYLYIALTIAFTVYGQLVLKWRISNLNISLPVDWADKVFVLIKLIFDPFIFSGIVAAFLASLAWMAAMTKFELNYAYPFMAMNFVLVFLLSVLVLGENMSYNRVLGLLLIVTGMIVSART